MDKRRTSPIQIKKILIEFTNVELNRWVSVKNHSLLKILSSNNIHKKYATKIIDELIKYEIIETRGNTNGLEFKFLKPIDNVLEIAKNIVDSYSAYRHDNYLFSREKLVFGGEYFIIVNFQIFQCRIIGMNKDNENVLYNAERIDINDNTKYVIEKELKYSDFFVSLSSASDILAKRIAKNCIFLELKL